MRFITRTRLRWLAPRRTAPTSQPLPTRERTATKRISLHSIVVTPPAWLAVSKPVPPVQRPRRRLVVRVRKFV